MKFVRSPMVTSRTIVPLLLQLILVSSVQLSPMDCCTMDAFNIAFLHISKPSLQTLVISIPMHFFSAAKYNFTQTPIRNVLSTKNVKKFSSRVY